MFIVIFGNPLDGFNHYGPFETTIAASEFAEAKTDGSPWWIVKLCPK